MLVLAHRGRHFIWLSTSWDLLIWASTLSFLSGLSSSDRYMSEYPSVIQLRILSASFIDLSTENMRNEHKYKVLTSSTEYINTFAVFQWKINKLIPENSNIPEILYLLETIQI